MDKIQLRLYDSNFNRFAFIDDYSEISFTHNLYEASVFTITINENIPNANKFKRGVFVQFGQSQYDIGEIISVSDAVDSTGKGGQKKTITGYDLRYLFKRRIIKNMNNGSTWAMSAAGELVMRNLIADQCGVNAEEKRRLPIINEIPEQGIGNYYSASESYSNLYETLVTIATQTEVGWRIKFDEGTLTLEFFSGEDLSSTVFFSPSFNSLASGNFTETSDSYINAVYIGGAGDSDNREIYEGEDSEDTIKIKVSSGTYLVDEEGNNIVVGFVPPEGLNRYEMWDDQSSFTTQEEFRTRASNLITQYMQDYTVSGAGCAKSPFIYRENYNVGDYITLKVNGHSNITQILSVGERWSKGVYNLTFSFGKPIVTLSRQLQLMLKKIQASKSSNGVESVRWYEIPDELEMQSYEVEYGTIAFTGQIAGGGNTFMLYLNGDVGAKTYNVYTKNLTALVEGEKLTLSAGGTDTVELEAGTYVTRILVDTDGNVYKYQ